MIEDKILEGIYLYGFYPALCLLKEFQDNEDYEMCGAIKNALDKVSRGREVWLSSSTENVSMDRVYKMICLEFNRPGIYINNLPYYVEEFREFLKKQSQFKSVRG